MKIEVMGYSGSGKSTLCRKLAEIYNVPHLHLDTVHFLPNWAVRNDEEKQEIVKENLANRDWAGIYILENDYPDEYTRPSQITEYVFLNLEADGNISVSIINKDGRINYLPKEVEYDGRQLAEGENNMNQEIN